MKNTRPRPDPGVVPANARTHPLRIPVIEEALASAVTAHGG